MASRRRFISLVPLVGIATLTKAAPPTVDPKDPQAAALGYVLDASKVDKAKYPRYAAGQDCASCALYQGPATAPTAPCAIFQSKHVAARAWCSAFVKRP